MPPDDHFSKISAEYREGRIGYPVELYEFLLNECEHHECAWDCATGSGQAAKDLSKYFDRVIATDISNALLESAARRDNIESKNAPAEVSGISTGSIDLVTVAQAIHWFEHDRFWPEVERVLKPGGLLAYWGYVWPEVNSEIDSFLSRFRQTIANFWPERSRYLHAEYTDLDAPFDHIESPRIQLKETWSPAQYLKHLSSWSGTRYHREASGKDIISEMEEELNEIWGRHTRTVEWNLALKVYRTAKPVSAV